NKKSVEEAAGTVQYLLSAYDQLVRLQQQAMYEEFFRIAPKEYAADYTPGAETVLSGIVEEEEDGTIRIR
ncbi:MAG: hypothetical protein WCH07_11525, partial [Deltaproteobacteria bacterium]